MIGANWRAVAGGAAVVVALAVVPLVAPRDDLLNLLFQVFLYVALAASWNVLGGYAGQVNLGHAAFFGTGALVARVTWLAGWPLPLAFVAGAAAGVVIALAIGLPTFRLRGVYFSVGTLALAEMLRITVTNTQPNVSALPTSQLIDYSLQPRYWVALAVAACAVAATYALAHSRLGLGMVAVREDEDAAQATGVDALRHKIAALVISALFAGLAGAVFAYHDVSYYLYRPFSPLWTFDPLLAVFIGGVGTVVGPVIGAFFYVVVSELLAQQLVELHLIVFGALFILVVLLLPGGLMEAWHRVRRVLSRPPSAVRYQPTGPTSAES
ncbi:MAG TPA: branched-chain amino acid ABC transporter permease [Chloroflexota bacterium]|nr:branched-chain amino acid ABC transporter permease [Chloroflexota bacterium]